MPAKKAPPEDKPKRLQDLPHTAVASRAADAMVKVFLEGKKPAPSAIPQILWRACREKGDGGQCRPFFRSILEGPVYAKLLEIRMRRVTLSSVEEVVFLKDVARDIIKLSGDSLVEELLIDPMAVSANDKRQIFQGAAAIYEKLTPKSPEGAGEQLGLPAATPEETAINQAAEVEERLSRLPKELRDRMIRQWKLDEIHAIDAREVELLNVGQSAGQTDDGVPAGG